MQLILASTSPYRKQLLARLQLPFTCVAPGTDETPAPGEAPAALAARLATAKARAIAQTHKDALVVGSDQVAALGDTIFGKPGDFNTAFTQLQQCAGQQVTFYTAVALVCEDQAFFEVEVVPFRVKFRSLSAEEISEYLRREEPYDCAGSFKCEGLGVVLFESLSGDDPTSLEGLPLIALSSLLGKAGYPVLSTAR